MSDKNISRLFKEKADKHASDLGKAISDVDFKSQQDCHVQRFENGVILGYMKDLTMDDKLICVYGKLFHAWWNKQEAEWLGKPLEDIFMKKNREGYEIMVQRFENGVINCRSDGGNDVQWLSWHDWHAISCPGDNEDSVPGNVRTIGNKRVNWMSRAGCLLMSIGIIVLAILLMSKL